MCGIAGVVGIAGAHVIVARMLEVIGHRGPDNTSLWSEGDISLGHVRLSIVDLSPQGNQPMFSEDEGVVLTGNGEIYNAPELRRGLLDAGHAFRSHSDNEVLLHLYEDAAREGDEDWPLVLNGMIAFGLFDRIRRRLILGRDRLGIKPLYYAQIGGGLIFASEIKAILASGLIRAKADPEGFAQYLTFENTFGAQTLFAGMRMVEPGQTLVFEAARLRAHRYWDVVFRDETPMTFAEACDEFLVTAKESVARHLMSDVEIATYLSGGIDSTSVATLALENLGTGVATFNGRFDVGGWYDESGGARAVAERIGSRHSEVVMGPDDFAVCFDDLMYHLDEPRMGYGSFSQYVVAREASKSVKVILTGHGGDEFFGGYQVFKFAGFLASLPGDPGRAFRLLRGHRPREIPHLAYFLLQPLLTRARRTFLPLINTRRALMRMLQPRALAQLGQIDPRAGLTALIGDEPDTVRRLTRVFMKSYLPGLFTVEDKISMAHSLESRTPLCDNAMVDLSLRVPFELKLHGGELKAIPRAAMRSRLPEILYGMPKRGFPTPLRPWFRSDLSDFVRSRLSVRDTPLHSIFTPNAVRGILDRQAHSPLRRLGAVDELFTHRVWQMLCLDSWMRRFDVDPGDLAEWGGA